MLELDHEGKQLKEDLFYEKDLLKDKKELSEHLMLLDLGRNDAGKVSKSKLLKLLKALLSKDILM